MWQSLTLPRPSGILIFFASSRSIIVLHASSLAAFFDAPTIETAMLSFRTQIYHGFEIWSESYDQDNDNQET